MIEIKSLKISQYLLCKYDEKHWIGMVSEVNNDAKDVKIKFMHPFYPSSLFNWPSRDDISWVPHTHLVAIIDTPMLSSSCLLFQEGNTIFVKKT